MFDSDKKFSQGTTRFVKNHFVKNISDDWKISGWSLCQRLDGGGGVGLGVGGSGVDQIREKTNYNKGTLYIRSG